MGTSKLKKLAAKEKIQPVLRHYGPALIGLLVKTAAGVQTFGFLAMFPLVFGSNLLVNTQTMPGWLQAFVEKGETVDSRTS